MEYLCGGSLDVLLYNPRNTISEYDTFEILSGVAAGMLHLHKEGIIHRNLAARNVLLTETRRPKITDFGVRFGGDLSSGHDGLPFVGPLRWMAPEAINGQDVPASDVWSFGILIYEVVTRKQPHSGVDCFVLPPRIRDSGYSPQIPKCSQVLAELMQLCWKYKPERRPQFHHICDILKNKKGREYSYDSLDTSTGDADNRPKLGSDEEDSVSQNYEMTLENSRNNLQASSLSQSPSIPHRSFRQQTQSSAEIGVKKPKKSTTQSNEPKSPGSTHVVALEDSELTLESSRGLPAPKKK